MESQLRPPNLFDARKVLAVQPHYDDNDIGAGGTLASLADNAAELIYLTVTDDLVGVVDQSLPDDEMAAALKDDQRRAGEIIGVKQQYWLGFPDAGDYDYFELRRMLIQYIRMLRPDFVFTVDPWMPYEAHNDHVFTGKAVAEAAILFGLRRLATDPEIDAAFEADPFDLEGIAFYHTAHPNTVVDITATHQRKHRAVAQYRAQFTGEDMERLLGYLGYQEKESARDEPFQYGEPLKVLKTLHLHGYPQAIHT